MIQNQFYIKTKATLSFLTAQAAQEPMSSLWDRQTQTWHHMGHIERPGGGHKKGIWGH